MGMYNEVFKRCPHCGGRGYLQISQIVLGFGCFDLDDPEDLADKLNEPQLLKLADRVKDEWFRCQNQECERGFLLEDTRAARQKLARQLFGPEEPQD